MKIKEKIYKSINEMDYSELNSLYEQIKLMTIKKDKPKQLQKALPVEKIHEMTASDDGSWSDDIVKDREDRL